MSSSKILRKTLAQPCEKALDGSCKYATKKCFEAVPYRPDIDRSIPARRWIDCWGWAATLKMHFDKRSGRWVYLSEETRKKLDKLKLTPEESYDEIVRRLIRNMATTEQLEEIINSLILLEVKIASLEKRAENLRREIKLIKKRWKT